jgi:hypothetical protein
VFGVNPLVFSIVKPERCSRRAVKRLIRPQAGKNGVVFASDVPHSSEKLAFAFEVVNAGSEGEFVN